MLNLNYNIIGSNQKIVERQGAIFGVRNDPFSSSLIVAIPCNLFFDGDYTNQFGMTTAFDDISAYVKGNGVPVGSNLTTAVLSTGSYVAEASNQAIKWAEQHYNTSLYFSGSSSLSITNTWASKQGANLTFEKDFVIETWALWPVTASVILASGSWKPDRYFAYKYDPTVLSTSAYLYEPWGGNGDNGGPLVSGSSRFVYDVAPSTEYTVTGSISSLLNNNQFNHYALSYTSQSFVDALNDKVIRMYINGILVGRYKVTTGDINQDTTELLQVFGAIDAPGDIYSQTPGYFTDFRLYNGSNKNYTGSIIPLPESMITWG